MGAKQRTRRVRADSFCWRSLTWSDSRLASCRAFEGWLGRSLCLRFCAFGDCAFVWQRPARVHGFRSACNPLICAALNLASWRPGYEETLNRTFVRFWGSWVRIPGAPPKGIAFKDFGG